MMSKDVFRKEPEFTNWLCKNSEMMYELLVTCNLPTSKDDLDCFPETVVHGGRIDIWEDVSQTLIEANYGFVDKEHLCKPTFYTYGMIQKYGKLPKRIIILTEKSDEESRGFIKFQNETTTFDWYLAEFSLAWTKDGSPHASFHLIVSPTKEKILSEIRQRNSVEINQKEQLDSSSRNTTKPDYRTFENFPKLKGIPFLGKVGTGPTSVEYTIEWVGPDNYFKSNFGFEGTLNSVGYNTRQHIALNILKHEEYHANGNTWKCVKNVDDLCIDDILSK